MTQTKDSDCEQVGRIAQRKNWQLRYVGEGKGSVRHDFSDFWFEVPFANRGMPRGVHLLWPPSLYPFPDGSVVCRWS